MAIPSKQLGSCNALFTGSAPLPAVTLLLPSKVTLTVTPKLPGDVLRKGEVITATPGAVLQDGLNQAYAVVTADNTVVIGLSATLSITPGTTPLAWAIAAHRATS